MPERTGPTDLDALLRRAGLRDTDTATDPFATWLRLRATVGDDAGLVTLYALEARVRGVPPQQLPADVRRRLAERMLHTLDPRFELTPGSGRSDPLTLTPYDPAWATRFAFWRDRIAAALGPTALLVAHVGSTSVPGLLAKPVVDVQVSVPDHTDEAAFVPQLADAGLQLRSRDTPHRYFRPFADRPRDVHVHVCSAGGDWEREHLLFRDYLRAHEDARDAYGRLKTTLAAAWPDDRMAYTEEKGDFIRATVAVAEVWAVDTGWRVAGGTSRTSGPSDPRTW